MDYVTRQFIVLTKKFRKELPKLAELVRHDLKQHSEAVHAAKKRSKEQQDIQPVWLEPVIAKYQEPVGDKKVSDNRHYRIQNSIRWATWCAFLAASFYGGVSYLQWHTAHQALIEGRETTTKQLQKLDSYITAANTANDIAIAANRPWFGSMPSENPKDILRITPSKDEQGEFTDVKYIWQFKNGGKRPARLLRVHTTGGAYKGGCPENPQYGIIPPGMMRPPQFQGHKTSRALVIPDVVIRSLFGRPIPADEWRQIVDGKLTYCIYASIEYQDIAYPAITHHTTDCRMLVPLADYGIAECTNNYANAD